MGENKGFIYITAHRNSRAWSLIGWLLGVDILLQRSSQAMGCEQGCCVLRPMPVYCQIMPFILRDNLSWHVNVANK